MRTGPRFILEPPLDLDHCPNTRLLGGCFFGEMRDSSVPEKSSGTSNPQIISVAFASFAISLEFE